ncbi:MAG: hypothetical protein ACM30I_10670 [Gemmatimonas sp.]
MRTITRFGILAASAFLALSTTAAHAAMVEGKIMYLGAEEATVTINKKTYRVTESTKVLVSGKPGSYSSLKPGMSCKANIAHGLQTTSISCTGKGRDPLPSPFPAASPAAPPPNAKPAGTR